MAVLKVRVVPTLLFKEFGLVKGLGFDAWRRVGTPMQAVKVYNLREVDELVFLDITATAEGRTADPSTIDELADECFMPLTVGGGVRTIEDVRVLLDVGADRVLLNTAAVEDPAIVTPIADRFGVQSVVVGIDARRIDGGHEVFVRCGTVATGRTPVEVARAAETAGAGELVVTSIERDGTMTGYDLELVRAVADAVSIPVVASGGAGTYAHLADAVLEGGASAVAAASMFHFTEQTPREAKQYLGGRGIPVRL